MSYVDLHCHLLSGVDDGARTEADSLDYAQRLHAEGVRDVVVTPHVNEIWHLDVLSIQSRVAELDDRLRRAGVRLRLHAGAEVSHRRVASLDERELQAVSVGAARAPWILLEAPFGGVDGEFLAAAAELRARRFGIVIAHPERCPDIARGGLERLQPLLAGGAVLQVNVCSLLGNHGLDVQEAAVRILRGGLAYALASDAHPATRGHTLALGFHLALAAGASSVQAWRLTQSNPRFLLRHGIPAEPAGLPRTTPPQPAIASQRE